MSLVTWVKTNSRALGKIGLYATGGFLVGWPLIRFGTNLYAGNSVEASAHEAIKTGFGIDSNTGGIDNTKLRNGAVRTGLGALAIYAARKM